MPIDAEEKSGKSLPIRSSARSLRAFPMNSALPIPLCAVKTASLTPP